MIYLILLLYLFIPGRIYAAPQVLITDYPQTVVVGDMFSLNFNVSSADIGTTFHFKAVGDSNTDISIFPSCASRYDDCLNIIIADPATNSATASLKINIAQALNFIKIRIAKSDNHASTYDSQYVTIASILPTLAPTPIATSTPTPTKIIPSPIITLVPTTSQNYLSITELMANPETNQDEWIEIYNATDSSTLINDLCFRDASNHSRCLPDNLTIDANTYYSHSFSSGFLNNDGDTIYFLDSVITYPKSPQNYSYSRQNNNSWCFANPSLNTINNECLALSTSTSSSSDPSPPKLSLQSTLSPVSPGKKFTLTFNLESGDPYSLRLNSPFGNHYAAFSDYREGRSWLMMELTVPKTLAPGSYPLQFHLKKEGSSHLFDYQFGNLVVTDNIVIKKIVPKKTSSKNQILGVSSTASFVFSPISTCTASTLVSIKPDQNTSSWPIFFLGSILFLSPIIFPKIFFV